MLQVEGIELGTLRLQSLRSLSLLPVKRIETIGNGVCCHGENSRADIFLRVWHPHDVGRVINLLADQFFGIVTKAFNVSLRILPALNAQVLVESQLLSKGLDGLRQLLLIALSILIGENVIQQLLIGLAQVALMECRRQIGQQCGV